MKGPMGGNVSKMLVIVAMSGALLSGPGCRRHSQQSKQAPPPPVVKVAAAQHQDVIEWDEFTGRTVAVENVEVRPRVSGHIEAVKFQSGQLVKKGDVLFQIDARWHKAEFDRRAAEYESAKVKLANADREAKRTTQLLASKAISTEEGDQRQARFEEARAMLLAAEAARDTAKLDLEYTTIRSPINGRISRALVTEGNYVGGVAGTGTLLTTIVSIDPIHIYADVDENSLLKFNKLMRSGRLGNSEGKVLVEMQLADESGFPHKGFIESFDNKVDAQSGSILLRAVFQNTDGHIVPGLFARIRVPASERHPAVLIQETAIGTDQAQKFVLTVTSSNTVAYRPIKLGPEIEGKRLVRDGLQPGEQIVQNIIMARVRPGMAIQPQTATNDTGTPVQTAQR